MGTWRLFSLDYCAKKSSCVLIDAWLQLILVFISAVFIMVLVCGFCRGRRRRRLEFFSQNGVNLTWGQRFLEMITCWTRKTAPLPLAVIQKDADAALITSHKNSTKHAAAFIQQTQRIMTKMDLMQRRDTKHQPTRASSSSSLSFVGKLSSFNRNKQSEEGSPKQDAGRVTPQPDNEATETRKPTIITAEHEDRRISMTGSLIDDDDAPNHRPTLERSLSLRQRLVTVLSPRRPRDRSATQFEVEVPNYKKRQKLAALSPEYRTRRERRTSVELRDKRRLSIGMNSRIQFQVSGGDKASVYEIKLKEIHLVKRLAFGPLSEVYAAIWRDTKVGVKLLMPREGVVDRLEEAVKNFRREIWVMNSLKHPNIVKLIGASLTPTCYVLVMEYMPNGSLYDYLRDKDNFFPHQLILTSALDIAVGMNHTHQNNVLQRDLKSKNCLVSEHLVVKVADFGLARFKYKTYGDYTFVGTPYWAAPEVIRHEPYDEKADVYSYAIVLWELVERKDPYEGLNAFQVPLQVANDGLRPAEFTKSAPLGLDHLMKQCWDSNPNQRPTFEEISETLNKWLKPEEDDDDAAKEEEDDLSMHIQRERHSVTEEGLHRFASSHDANAKVIPILLSRGYSERLALRRKMSSFTKSGSDRSFTLNSNHTNSLPS